MEMVKVKGSNTSCAYDFETFCQFIPADVLLAKTNQMAMSGGPECGIISEQ